MQIFFINF